MKLDTIGDRGDRCLVQHNIEYQVYIAWAIYVGGTGGATGGGASEVVCGRGAGSACVVGDIWASFGPPASFIKQPIRQGLAHQAGVQMVVVVEKAELRPVW